MIGTLVNNTMLQVLLWIHLNYNQFTTFLLQFDFSKVYNVNFLPYINCDIVLCKLCIEQVMDKKDNALVPLVPPENKVGLLFFILICYNYLNYNDLNGTALYVNLFFSVSS